MSVIHAPKKPVLDARTIAFPAAMGGLLSLLFLRLWYFQVVKAPELSERADASREMSVARAAPRGLIFDRNHVLIGGVRTEIVITARPDVVAKNPWVIDKVGAILGVSADKIRKKLKASSGKKFLSALIYVGANIEAGTRIAESKSELPGIDVDFQPMREYPDSVSFSHLMGYVWLPDERDLDRIKGLGVQPATYVGKTGLERAYEKELMGEPGAERMEVDAKRKPFRIVGRDNPVPGSQLTLTIDADLQKYATALMGQNGRVGAFVAIDPRNGEILSMVSSPAYDQRAFLGGITTDELARLNADQRHPLINRAIGASYSPGSTFKLVTTLAALETGKFDIHRSIYCNGGYKIGDRTFKCLGHHGSISFETALIKSCNTYFATLGDEVGEVALRKAAAELGLGEQTGIELSGESRGVVPTDEWVARWRKPPQWYRGDTVNLSIGQGDVRATPLQMANLMALVANRGVNYKPHLVKSMVISGRGNFQKMVRPQVLNQVNAPSEYWTELRETLVRVIEEGTGAGARIPGLRWAGKTGSTEHGKGKLTHGWFIAFAPAENPELAIAVLIEEAGHGGDIAAPIAREFVEHYLRRSAAAAAKAKALASAAATPLGSTVR